MPAARAVVDLAGATVVCSLRQVTLEAYIAEDFSARNTPLSLMCRGYYTALRGDLSTFQKGKVTASTSPAGAILVFGWARR
jgi:hypothetical protein